MKSSSVTPARLAAFEVLLRVEEGAYSSILLAARDDGLSQLDRSLRHGLVMGVLRRQLWLDRLIEYYANRKVESLDPAVRIILRLGLYQLRFLSRVPASAAVNESVNLAARARLRSSGGLINAVLRRATREPEVDPTSNIQDPIQRVAVAASHPPWLIERWTETFGSDEAEAFAHANNDPPPMAFRVVNNRAREADVIDQLRDAKAVVHSSRVAPGAWRVEGTSSLVSRLAARGDVYIQDEASQLVARVLDAKPGQTVLDLCAAPGGKATQIADCAHDSALVVAADLHEHRLRTVASIAKLHRLENVRSLVVDGLQVLPVLENSFDCVLVDAPCSGTGTLRRNPEIRWRISPADIQDLSGRQRQLLSNAAKTVKPGGRLVYSTCSIETEENEVVRQAFLDTHEDFESAKLQVYPSLITLSGAARTWPHIQGTDGFFICAFERKH